MFISFWVRACHWIILRTVSKTGMGNLKAGGGHNFFQTTREPDLDKSAILKMDKMKAYHKKTHHSLMMCGF